MAWRYLFWLEKLIGIDSKSTTYLTERLEIDEMHMEIIDQIVKETDPHPNHNESVLRDNDDVKILLTILDLTLNALFELRPKAAKKWLMEYE
jgi:hypothetical protein